MDPTIDRAKIHLTMNVDAQGNPSGGGGGGDASAANQTAQITFESRIADATEAIQAQAESLDPVPVLSASSEWQDVAASQTDTMLGGTGAAGDKLLALLITPTTTSPGAVSIKDGSLSYTVFAGGASSVTNLVPFLVPQFNIASVSSGWKITTGANVTVRAFGDFT